MSKELRIVVRCGDCRAVMPFGYLKKLPESTLGSWLWENDDAEEELFNYCDHGHEKCTGPVIHIQQLAHPVPTPWFVHVYGEPE